MVAISFEQPEYLWFLLVLPILAIGHFFLLRHAKRKAMKFANFMALKRITGEKLITKNYTVLVLRMTIVLFVIIAISQATLWYDGLTSENEYVIALDTSASMQTADILPNRLDAAKQYASTFVEDLDNNANVGLISFTGITFVEQVPTKDHALVQRLLTNLTSTASGTDIAGAIITGTNLLVNSDKTRALILITDGSNTIETFQSNSLRRAVEYAILHRVKVHTIGVGSNTLSPIGYLPQYYNVSSVYNADNLQYIANETEGEYYLAQNAEELRAAYDDIRVAQKEGLIKVELSGGFMLIAFTLLLMEWGLMNTRFRVFP